MKQIIGLALAAAVVTVAAAVVYVRLAAQRCGVTHADLDARREREAADLASAWGWLP